MWVSRFEDKRFDEHTKDGGEKIEGENMFESTREGKRGGGSLLSCIISPGDVQDKSTRQDMRKRCVQTKDV
jgi:hypothetical protein